MTASRQRILVLAAAIAATAIIVAVVALTSMRTPAPAANPTASAKATTTAAVGSPTPSAPPSPAATTSGPTVKPDGRHGLIVATGNMRTEDDPRGLQEPSLFMTAATSSYGVSPDGKRVALIRTAQTGQQIVTFTTTRPNDLTTVVDLAGSGERGTNVVWAGDGSNRIIFAVVKEAFPSGGGDARFEYAALRSVGLSDRQVREIVRVDGQNTRLWPLAWLPAKEVIGAVELGPRGPAVSYATIRGGTIERTKISPDPNVAWFSASRDGRRIVVSLPTSIRWWPTDQPGAAMDLPAQPGERVAHAEFRPGAEEIGVDVGSRFEIWTPAGQRRVIAERTPGFLRWRVDGTAAIASSDPFAVWLVDPVTGAKTQLPGDGFPVADVVTF